MRKSSGAFKKLIGRMLKTHGLKFKGIHVCCTNCDDKAFVATLELAAGFGGWTRDGTAS